ncbi:MAG TPA: glycosyltransferase family 2 protein, partial [Gemmatimonadaceae bacterium]
MRLSIVATLYGSAPYVAEFCRRAADAARQLTPDYEIVLVNDGSPDSSLALALDARKQDARIKVIDLARNFGHHKAMMTGLAHARGDLVFLIDSDLEEPPELLNAFKAEMGRTRADVVYGVQQRRRGGAFERATGAMYYSLFNAITSLPVPRNLLTVRLMTQRYVQSLVAHRERELNIGALWTFTGFAQVAMPVDKAHKGTTSYNLRKRIAHLVNSVTSFSSAPLVFVFYLGVSISLFSGIFGSYLIVRRLFFGVLLEGWPSLIVSVWFLGGLTLLSLGVLGVYLAKVFTEVKQRPYTVIREI